MATGGILADAKDIGRLAHNPVRMQAGLPMARIPWPAMNIEPIGNVSTASLESRPKSLAGISESH